MLLALDLGTTNVKAMVTDLAGRPLSRHSCPIQLFHLSDGGVEQDIEEIWQATLVAIRQSVSAVRPSEVSAIGVSSQGGAMQILDASGNPVGRVISWLDQRGRPFGESLTAELGRTWFLQRIAHGRAWLAVGQLLRLQREQPEQLAAQNRIGFVGDIIVARLCGRAAQDGTSAGLTLLYDPISRTYAPDLLDRIGMRAQQLPLLLSARDTAGGLTPFAAAATSLRAGIPVSAAVHDQYASALATGAVRAGIVMLGTGTAWVLLSVSDHMPTPLHDDALVCHHVEQGLWGQIVSMINGGSALTWALELTGHGAADADQIDRLMEAAPPGSDELLFWPFMTPAGAIGMARGIRGRLSGLQLSHRDSHIVRAVVEGLACELARHLDFLRGAGQRIEHLAIGGGAASSRVTPQILADVTGLPLRCTGGASSLLGAAIIARGLLEPDARLADLAKAMMPEAVAFEPGSDAPFYREHYRRYVACLPLEGAVLP